MYMIYYKHIPSLPGASLSHFGSPLGYKCFLGRDVKLVEFFLGLGQDPDEEESWCTPVSSLLLKHAVLICHLKAYLNQLTSYLEYMLSQEPNDIHQQMYQLYLDARARTQQKARV